MRNKKFDEFRVGHTTFFTWPSIVLGLVVMAALVLPFISDVHPVLALLVGGAAAIGCAWLWRTAWKARRALRAAEGALMDVEEAQQEQDRSAA